MADNISKTVDINLKMHVDSGVTKGINRSITGDTSSKSIANDINKEQTTTEKANEIDKLAGLTTESIFTKTIMSVPRLISSFVGFVKWAAPAILAAILASTAIGGWIADKMGLGAGNPDEETTNLKSEDQQSKFIEDITQQNVSNMSQQTVQQPQQVNYAAPTSPVSPIAQENTPTISEDIGKKIVSDEDIASVNELLKKSEKEITVTMDDSDFQSKAKIVQDMDLSTPINNMTKSLTTSIESEKTAMQGLFPVYNEFGELLAKIVKQMAYINNPEGTMSATAKELSSFAFETPKFEDNVKTTTQSNVTIDNTKNDTVGANGKGSPFLPMIANY